MSATAYPYRARMKRRVEHPRSGGLSWPALEKGKAYRAEVVVTADGKDIDYALVECESPDPDGSRVLRVLFEEIAGFETSEGGGA